MTIISLMTLLLFHLFLSASIIDIIALITLLFALFLSETCARRRQLGWFVSGLPWGIEPHDIPIGEQWGGR
jgi:hypothetical protein